LKVELVNTTSDVYPKLVDFTRKHHLFFNAPEWLKNYPAAQIFQAGIFNNNGDVIGCFNYFRFKKAVFKFVISPPFSPNIELFYVNPAESVVGRNSFDKDIIAAVTSYFDSLKVEYINVNLPEEVVDTQPFIWKGYTSKTRYSYLIDLSATKETLWGNLSSEKRKSVNKAEKDGLVIQASADYKLVYSLIIKSLERNDKAKNLQILKNILFSFANPENSFAFVAYHNNVAIGATFCLSTKEKAVYLLGGFDSENKHHGAGVSCMWQSILKAKELGLKYFDFEGSMNTTIERYFREFGGKLIPYFCVEKIKPGLKALLAIKKHNPI
jgi:hypothetical protein